MIIINAYKEMIEKLEDELVSNVSGKKLMEYTENIASWVRVSGTREEVESLEYCQKILDDIGYATELSYHQGFISVPVSAFVELRAPKSISFKAITHPFVPSTPVSGIEAEIVSGSCPSKAGKIVLSDGLPDYDEVKAAERAGAVGIIYAQDDYLHNAPISPLWGGPVEKTENLLVNIPVASITRNDGSVIKECMESGKTVIYLETVVDTGFRKVPLLEANVRAKDTDKFLLFSSHIDSWDYGAMDNGAANATLLECARLLMTKKDLLLRGLRLVFWAGHSQGKFFSSTWYADNHFEELEENCIGHVYVDSTGGKDAVIIEEAPVMPQTRQLAYDVIKKQTGKEFFGKRIGHFADQSFYGVGLTSIFGTFSEQDKEKTKDVLSFSPSPTVKAGGLGWWWHTEHDTIDKIDEDILIRDTKVYVAVIWRLLTDAVLAYDFREAVTEMRQTVDGIIASLGDRANFLPMRERLDILQKAVDAFYLKAESIKEPGSKADIANQIILGLSKKIVRIAFHGDNCYDFDLSGPMFPIQSLSDSERLAVCPVGSYRYYVLQTQLLRGYNRVMGYLKDSLAILSEDTKKSLL